MLSPVKKSKLLGLALQWWSCAESPDEDDMVVLFSSLIENDPTTLQGYMDDRFGLTEDEGKEYKQLAESIVAGMESGER